MNVLISIIEVAVRFATQAASFLALIVAIYQLWRTRNNGLCLLLLGIMLGGISSFLEIFIPKDISQSLPVNPTILHLASLLLSVMDLIGAVFLVIGFYYLFPRHEAIHEA
jgi:hypothetical protein